MTSMSRCEFRLEEGQTFLLPTDAIYRISDKLDDASDQSSAYSNEPQLAIADDEQFDESSMGSDEFCRRLVKFGFDINGLPLRDDLLFETYEEAADFTPCVEDLTAWQKLRGYIPRNVEVPHIALWDYFGGSSCLDINCTATDQINVLCEEYQVCEVGNIVNDNRRYLRLPMRWSLGRWITNRPLQPIVSLIPSCWLTTRTFYEENKRLFKRPTWYIGISDVTTAYDYLLEDRSSLRPGLFVIFSPIWLNIDPRDHRPFILLLTCCKTPSILREMLTSINAESKTTAALDDLHRHIKTTLAQSDVNVNEAQPNVTANPNQNTARAKGAKLKSTGAQDAHNTTENESNQDARLAEHAALPFYIKPYTIRRNRIGRFLLFGRQYETLYDLVHHLTTHRSALSHKLNYGPARKQQVAFFAAIPPPLTSARAVCAMNMQSEQWAARHFDQVIEPSLLSQAFSFISRSIFDPFKSSHLRFAEAAQLEQAVIDDARTYMQRFPRPKDKTGTAKGIDAKKAEGDNVQAVKPIGTSDGVGCGENVPTDESVLKTNPGIELDYKKLIFHEEDILGSGAFGAVYRGKMKTSDNREIDVAIKKLKMVAPEADLRQPWISEMEILQILTHPNVARFYGFCYDELKEHAMLTFELMNIGSLSDFVKAHDYKLSANEHVDFMIQIARGMGQLHALDPPIIHGDLAARNVLMCHHPTDDTRYLLKVSDFGLSKTTRHELHVFPDDPDKMPFKWLPPEVLHRREMSTKSDVWAYGITATEMYGVVDPYGMMSNEKVLPFLNDGHRMEKPATMPCYIYDLILQCWRKQPVDRPCFDDIERKLLPFYIGFETSHMELVSDRLAAERNEQENEGDDKANAKILNQ